LFIYIMNSSGERLHPCLTPQLTVFHSEVSACNLTAIRLRL
jgi:hypothetical protein